MLPFKVYGINLAIRVLSEPPPGVSPLHCPQGHPMRYGAVVQTGDGFDEAARSFREMPKTGAIVAFEESQEGVEGHYFYLGEDEFRILPIDAIIIAFSESEG
ncbi:MAG: hypothetical protein L0214_11025 [candidate division NC10 bacterium]|nr:hypothetical protein [candidate division NC10 bacterium]